MTSAAAVTVFHREGDAAGFGLWSQDLLDSARSASGHLAGNVSEHADPRLDWAVAVTFSDEERLHGWLDSSHRAEVLRDGQRRGYWRSSADLILTDEGPAPPGVGLFRHAVASGREGEFRRTRIDGRRPVGNVSGHRGRARHGHWHST